MSRTFRKKTYRKRGKKDKVVTWKALKKHENKIIELKYLDAFAYNQSMTTYPGATDLFTAVVQGVTDQDRIGDRLFIKSIRFRYIIRGSISSVQTTVDPYDTVRVILFQYHNNNFDIPTLTSKSPDIDTILAVGPVSGSQPDVYSQYNWDNRNDYTILYDKTYVVSGYNTGAIAGYINNSYTTGTNFAHHRDVFINLNKKGFKRQIEFWHADPQHGSNHLYICYLSDSAISAHPTLSSTIRVTYTDS